MTTALELPRAGWGSYIEAMSRRPAPPESVADEQGEQRELLARVREAARTLKRRFGVRRVVLFGSLAHASWFISDSDVDLAVEGLDTADYWQAWGLAEEIIGDRPVDFIQIEAAGESLRQAIGRHGVEL